jgi:DNA-directed RNA polymerase subunit RPC12/RpoP
MTPETLAKIRGAHDAAQGLEEKVLRCPYCNHRVADKFQGAAGQIRAKCSGCKREVIIDLVSWRRVRVN